jgi:hypothetical protein
VASLTGAFGGLAINWRRDERQGMADTRCQAYAALLTAGYAALD